jgi:hypothetical protein
MSQHRAGMVVDVQAVACVKCGASLLFRRSAAPHIDDCGFESYRIACDECGSELAGIIDPCDESLLLSEAV